MSIAPEVTRAKRCHPRPGLRAHCGALRPDEITSLSGIPVTSAPRTVLDFAAMSTERQLEKALNELEVQGITDKLSIPELIERYPRKRGTATRTCRGRNSMSTLPFGGGSTKSIASGRSSG